HDAIIKEEWVTLFEQDLKTGYVWCRWEHVWSVLWKHHSGTAGSITDVQRAGKLLLEEHLGWRVESPAHVVLRRTPAMEEHLGGGVGSPEEAVARYRLALKEHVGWRVETTDGHDITL